MGQTRRNILLTVLKFLDLTLMVISFGIATIPVLYENAEVSFEDFFSMRIKLQNFLIFLGLMLAWHLIFFAVGAYKSRRFLREGSGAFDTFKATSLCALSMGITSAICHVRMMDLTFVLVFWGVSSALVALARLGIRHILKRRSAQARFVRNALIVGTNPRAVDVARKIEPTPELGVRVIGFADENWGGMEAFEKTGYRVVCNFEDFPEFLRKAAIDEVVMALPIKSFYYQVSRMARLCEEQGIVFSVLPAIFDLRIAHSRAESFEGESLLTHYTGQVEGWPAFFKRVLDFTVALTLLVLLAPLFLVAAILIKLTSPGPVFFGQERIGLNKHRFRIWKFRTMVPDAERKLAQVEALNEVSGPVFKIANDPRVTPIGRFLRKTSIDELPQLFNVLKGEMSLVGPRPLPVRDYEGFDRDWHRRRFSVRPGITCLWQVNGRSSIPFEQWMRMDMEYIDHWSLWLDMKILINTIPAVLRGSGAA
jgi:exopolysaccharide biosynthesis polyprenyl glycosylphosphotransferase